MYGKAFSAMYEGSMVGAGCNVFAVWNYVIAKNRSGIVELNPKLLAFVLGADGKEIDDAIDFLCKPDPESRSKEEGGRRLIREGEYQYRMVNWQLYDRIKSQEALRDYNARKQAEYREKKKLLKNGKPLPGEEKTLAKLATGEITQEQADAAAAENGSRDAA